MREANGDLIGFIRVSRKNDIFFQGAKARSVYYRTKLCVSVSFDSGKLIFQKQNAGCVCDDPAHD